MENEDLIKKMDNLIFTNKDFSKNLSRLVNGILQDYANRGIYFGFEGLEEDALSIDTIAAPNGLLPIFITKADEIHKELFGEPLEYNMISMENEDDEHTFMNMYVDILTNDKQNAIIWTHIMSFTIEDLVMKKKMDLDMENGIKKKSNFFVSLDEIFDFFHEQVSQAKCSVIREREMRTINDYRV